MIENKIIDRELYINGVPWSKWTSKEWNIWKGQTTKLLEQCERIGTKLELLYRMRIIPDNLKSLENWK